MDCYSLDPQRQFRVICLSVCFIHFRCTYGEYYVTCKHTHMHTYLEWKWALGQRRGGQDVKGGSMSNCSPSHDINERESSWIVGVGEEGHLFSKSISSLHVSLSILLWHSSLGQRGAVEWQENETSQGKGGNGSSSDNQVDVRDGLGGHHSLLLGHRRDSGHSNSGRWGSDNHL